jgi:hypothetical protein
MMDIITDEPNDIPFSMMDSGWRRFPQKTHEQLGLATNDLYYHGEAKQGALVAKLGSRYLEIAVSANGLNYLHAAVLGGDKITSGMLVLAKWEGTQFIVIVEIPIIEVIEMLKDIPPKEGPYGPYWWFNQDGTPHDRSQRTSYGSLDEPPF